MSHSVIFNFNFEDLDSNCLKTVLHSFFEIKFKKIIEDSVSFLNQIIKTLKNLKYMMFLKMINTDDAKKLQVAVKKCENIFDVLNECIQILNVRKEFR